MVLPLPVPLPFPTVFLPEQRSPQLLTRSTQGSRTLNSGGVELQSGMTKPKPDEESIWVGGRCGMDVRAQAE